MESRSLFEGASTPASLLSAFEAWLEDQRATQALRQPSSLEVYREMWRGFMGWCLGQSPAVSLSTLNVADLEAFRSARSGTKSADQSLSPRHALRLMRLIDRVLRHQAAQSGHPPNTAASDWLSEHPEVRWADVSSADPLPEFLSVSEAKHLITFLSVARPRPGLRADRDAHAAFSWQELRNRVALALHLGGGLTPGDVRALTLQSPVSRGGASQNKPWKLSIPAHGDSPARETPIASWAAELLQHWLQVRQDSAIAGPWLLPSTRTGKPWGKQSHYASTRALLAEAGLDAPEGGTFRLRHTFALRQLKRGTDAQDVARWLGVEPAVMDRYQRVIAGPVTVV